MPQPAFGVQAFERMPDISAEKLKEGLLCCSSSSCGTPPGCGQFCLTHPVVFASLRPTGYFLASPPGLLRCSEVEFTMDWHQSPASLLAARCLEYIAFPKVQLIRERSLPTCLSLSLSPLPTATASARRSISDRQSDMISVAYC